MGICRIAHCRPGGLAFSCATMLSPCPYQTRFKSFLLPRSGNDPCLKSMVTPLPTLAFFELWDLDETETLAASPEVRISLDDDSDAEPDFDNPFNVW